jgi:outer membrane autotransporter protein
MGAGYRADAVLLKIFPRRFDDPYFTTTDNQRAVSSVLQNMAHGGGNSITTALQQLGSPDDVRSAYDQLSGQSRPSLAPVTDAGSGRHVGTVSNRLHNVRGGVSYGFAGRPLLAMAEPGSVAGNTSTYDVSPNGGTFAVGNGTDSLADQKWGFWGKGYAVFGDRESESGAPGYQYTVYGTGFGLDYQFTDMLLLGITGGYSDGDVDYFSSRDTSDVSSIPLGVYGSWNAENWYFDSLLSYADLEYETERHVDLTAEKLSGDFDGDQISGYFEGGLNWHRDGGWLVQPLASFQFSHLNLDSYTESGGAGSLGFDDQKHESHRGSLGVKLTKQFGKDKDKISVAVQLRGRWIHEFGDADSQVNAHFASDPGTVFTVSDEEVSRDTIVLGTSVHGMLSKNTRLFVSYDASLNADNTSHIVSAGLEHRW